MKSTATNGKDCSYLYGSNDVGENFIHFGYFTVKIIKKKNKRRRKESTKDPFNKGRIEFLFKILSRNEILF